MSVFMMFTILNRPVEERVSPFINQTQILHKLEAHLHEESRKKRPPLPSLY